MNKWFKQILSVNYLIKAPAYKFILIFFIPSILLGAVTTLLPEPNMAGSLATDSAVLDLLIAVVVIPLIETLLFQSLIIEVICRLIKRPRRNICIAVTVSSLAFALSHTYSVGYVVMSFLWGFIFAFAYYFGRYRKENAIMLVFVVHSTYNLLSSLHNLAL